MQASGDRLDPRRPVCFILYEFTGNINNLILKKALCYLPLNESKDFFTSLWMESVSIYYSVTWAAALFYPVADIRPPYGRVAVNPRRSLCRLDGFLRNDKKRITVISCMAVRIAYKIAGTEIITANAPLSKHRL